MSHKVARHRPEVFALAVEHDEGAAKFQVGDGHGA